MQVKQLMAQMQEVFVRETERLGRSSGFCQRRSPITAPAWVQGLVFGWMSDPEASVGALARALASAGASVSPQAVQQRFGPSGVLLLCQVLEHLTAYALQHGMLTAEAGHEMALWSPRSKQAWRRLKWMQVFTRIFIRDSTIISLPLGLREKWKGMGGFAGPCAGLKISVRWEWHSGWLWPFHISRASLHDQSAAEVQDQKIQELGGEIVAGEMHVFDLGFFKLKWLLELVRQGAYFCCRYKMGTHVIRMAECGEQTGEQTGEQSSEILIDWLAEVPAHQTRVEWKVFLGKKLRVPCRLLAVRVPEEVKAELQARLQAKCERKRQNLSAERLELCGWTVLVTNAPVAKLNFEQAFELYRLRWQIECLFRLWKECLHLDEWRSQNLDRIECEIYAKLIGALLTQQLTAYAAWSDPARSLKKCADVVARHAFALLLSLDCLQALKRIFQSICAACEKGARIETRRRKPSTYQRLKAVQIA